MWHSDGIWCHRSGSTVAHVMACAWRHQAISWTSVDLSSKVLCRIHPNAVSLGVHMILICNMCVEITLLNFYHINLDRIRRVIELVDCVETTRIICINIIVACYLTIYVPVPYSYGTWNWLSLIHNHLRPPDLIQNGRRNFVKYRDTSRFKSLSFIIVWHTSGPFY